MSDEITPKRVLLALGIVSAMGITFNYLYNETLRDDPEKIQGFSQIEEEYDFLGATIDDCLGDVIKVGRIPKQEYNLVQVGDTEFLVTGKFNYCIRPQNWFAPKDDAHTDLHSHSPYFDGDNYWCDTRWGKISLKKKMAE